MRIAIVGSKGQVGWELTRRAPMFGHEVLAWDQDELDITDATAVDQTLTASGAAVVINAAAYTAVDRAEQEPERAFAVNRDGVLYIPFRGELDQYDGATGALLGALPPVDGSPGGYQDSVAAAADGAVYGVWDDDIVRFDDVYGRVPNDNQGAK